MKRFWKTVSIDAERVVRLDDRPVRTPGRTPLAVPTDALAEAIAEEWRSVGEVIDPRAMRLTGLANAAIDRVAADPVAFAASLAKYGETDLLCYRALEPPPLVERQAAAWDPLLAWARTRYDVGFEVTSGVIPVTQPPQTIERLGKAVASRDTFALAGLSPLVTTTGSLVGALALAERAFDAETVWTAAQIDEDWQTEMWGEDSLATEAAAARRADFDAAARFLELLSG